MRFFSRKSNRTSKSPETDLAGNDTLLILPKDVLKYILCTFIDDKDVVSLEMVSKQWNDFCNQIQIWHILLQQLARKCASEDQILRIVSEVGGSRKKAYWNIKKNVFHWDCSAVPQDVFEFIEVSNNNRTVNKTKQNEARYITLWGNRCFKKGTGIYRWKIRVPNENHNYLKIGVCWTGQSAYNSIGYSRFGAGYGIGYKWRNGSLEANYGTHIHKGDVVECILDMNARTLAYVHNGKHWGIAFEDLPLQVYPAVSLDEAGECVELFFD